MKSLAGLLFLLLLCVNSSHAAGESYAGRSSMNDINFEEFKNFSEKWQLVTIRYRKDTGEMRLTYGNELAMKTLLSGSIDYPDGAVFAKTGLHTGVDDQFPSSAIPTGIRRYQLMVKDKKKYKTTGGWGYALFDPEGKTFPEEPVASQNACYACHAIVPNRGDVFSQAFSFVNGVKFPTQMKGSVSIPVEFVWRAMKKLPATIKSNLPATTKRVRWLNNVLLRKNVFQGTLDELKPVLEKEARQHQTPAVFMSADEKRFVVVLPTQSDMCMGEGAFKTISTDMNLKPVEESYCTHD